MQLLRLKRNNNCEICGMPSAEGRFHIISVGESLKLEFNDLNVLLSHWMRGCGAHFKWHHYGQGDPRCDFIVRRIKELRGEDYRADLKHVEFFMSRHDEFYLRALIAEFENELGAKRKEITNGQHHTNRT